ncbi:type II toxin-antitoxin system RelE/ParE family toxin [Phenylobacterium koreense]|uniref:Addiction module toxin RelE n=1 Tax=Phenylobacterium koreense TaxID=266125 RepID=A0ABV2EGX5_9CAUL
MNEVAYTEGFLAQAKDEGLTESELEALSLLLAANPEAGDLIPGSGGCRKVRLAGRGKGKSGGYRVVTFFARRAMPVYVFAILSKGSRENFSDREVATMQQVAKSILARLTPKAVG